MTPKQQKIAYSIFLSFFVVWLISILTGFLSPGDGTVTVAFTSQFTLALFLGAASLTAMSSLLLGLNLLGFNLTPHLARHSGKDMFSTKEINELRKLSPVNNSTRWNRQDLINQKEAKTSELQKEKKKREEERDRLKSFYLFGPNEFSKCTHKFGYLAEALKNQPIPDECFGCPNVVECVKSAENK